MHPTFDPVSLEKDILDAWEKAGVFRADREDCREAPPFSIVIPPPNVTGSLHMGHALNITLQDILCRSQRMRGKRVLWQPGTDHAGIATQMVVERQLAAKGEQDRRSLGRAAFVEKIWAWKQESGGEILRQLKRLGASCDWTRERFTLDAGLSEAVRHVFVKLYRDGLIYRDKRLVNWDPTLQTALSDLEVQPVETKGHLWSIAYPLVNEKGHETGERLIVATTRPETLLGDTGVAVHPDNERLRHLIGRYVRLPLVGRLIPIVGDPYADPEKGTGAVKITPAHDFNDFEIGRRHKLPLINIFSLDAHIFLKDNPDFEQAAAHSLAFVDGLERFKARQKILEKLEEEGLLVETKPHLHMVPHGDRSGVVLEPRLTEQWYVDAYPLAQPALQAVREGRTEFIPKNWEKTYFDWLEHIEPWCISRQLWWGHRIPAWYGLDQGKLQIFVAHTQEEAQAQAQAYYGGSTPPTLVANQQEAASLDHPALWQEEDVLDTWFSSSLWAFSTLGWPHRDVEDIRKEGFYPTSVLVTGFDIIFFWVARMMMMGLYIMQDVPFHKVYIHALVRDETGAKMSKSKGNVINPLELMETYGTDALRFTLASMAAQGRDIKLARSRVEGYRNFATKIWNVARFAQMNGCVRQEGYAPARVHHILNRWILSAASQTLKEVENALDAYRFNDAAQALYRFVWNVFCDWYVELTKPILQGNEADLKQEIRGTFAFTFDVILHMLHPFMPFLTEGLWKARAEKEPSRPPLLLAQAAWPDLSYHDATAEAQIGWIVDLVTELRAVRHEMRIPEGIPLSLVLITQDTSREKQVAHAFPYLVRLTRITHFSCAPQAPPQAAHLMVRGDVVALPLAGILDLEAERARLSKEADKIGQERNKLQARLENPHFLESARESAIEDARARWEEATEKEALLRQAIERLT